MRQRSVAKALLALQNCGCKLHLSHPLVRTACELYNLYFLFYNTNAFGIIQLCREFYNQSMKIILISFFSIILCASCSENPKTITALEDSTKVPVDTLRKPPIGKPRFPDVASTSEGDTIRK